MLQKFEERAGLRLAIGGAIVFGAIALALVLHRHFTFYSSYDQGIFNQVFWNGIHGRFFQSSLSSQLSTNVVHAGEVPAVNYHRLGQHFTPALLLWHPLYALVPHPATLSVLMVGLVTAAGFVLYALARLYVEPRVAGLIVLSYYSANAILGPTLANFHDVCQMPLFIFGLLLSMEKRWWGWFGVLAVLTLAVREDSGIALFGVGAYMVLSRRFPRIGLATCCASFIYMVALTNAIMPLFSDDISKRFMLERFGQYVDGDEATTLDVIRAMLTQPWLLVAELVTPVGRTLSYLFGQLLPFAFVPIASPGAWAIAGFPLLKLLLGRGDSVLAISIRYAMNVVPGLCYGVILWWAGQGWRTFGQSLERCRPRVLTPRLRRAWVGCICLSLLLTVVANPNRTLYFLVPDSIEPWVHISLAEQWPRSRQMHALLAEIPSEASVAATTYFIPHLSGRREIVRFPTLELLDDSGTVQRVEYAIADLWRLERYQVAFKHDRALLRSAVATIDERTASDEYGIVRCIDGVVLLQRGVASDAEAVANWQAYRQQIAPTLTAA
ncbi:putative membrane protein [Rubidibacter lacunae KORDI 51-2]|uniref:Putative membrane protein n=1 Tax=Rubidibacter lacunae KORDI 51-2 TaxID=582515 RepID=U5DLL2_9CHRO|nr:DUF2079 domain-containing protein [Rubidibacter lacunae]ERN41469.1 putative membrane protein [Rubidibacter lacunae KORDI 51-2]